MGDRELIERARKEAVSQAEAITTVTRLRYGENYAGCDPENLTLWKLADRLEALASRLSDGWRGSATNAMQIAGMKPLLEYLNDDTDTYRAEDLLSHIWAAMLSAAPERPAT